ncbi:MAG: phycobilisome protein [Aphanocapsa sp. GSE-SYN-MK-11-07L]|jgi:hypothetical protein|nr:phycobilisome protein [Aphanocapsa sp. GSE-SYN-MK-11-07L]
MHPDLESLFYKSEENFLEATEIKLFKHHIASLADRLALYECLRDQEVAIFQPVADQLLQAFPQQDPKLLEKSLKQWITVMRYATMAMLLNNPEFLQRRLLEWLTDVIQAHQTQAIEAKLCQLLQARLKEVVPGAQLGLIQPLLDQAQTTLLGSSSVYQMAN